MYRSKEECFGLKHKPATDMNTFMKASSIDYSCDLLTIQSFPLIFLTLIALSHPSLPLKKQDLLLLLSGDPEIF